VAIESLHHPKPKSPKPEETPPAMRSADNFQTILQRLRLKRKTTRQTIDLDEWQADRLQMIGNYLRRLRLPDATSASTSAFGTLTTRRSKFSNFRMPFGFVLALTQLKHAGQTRKPPTGKVGVSRMGPVKLRHNHRRIVFCLMFCDWLGRLTNGRR
jgi:hypothetical protein